MLQRHKKLVIGVVFTALVGITAQASAHVTAGNPTLEVVELNYRAPVEPAFTTVEELEARHTEKLVVSFPAGFSVQECDESLDYACTFTVDEVTWTRRPGSTNFGLQTVNGVPVVSPTGTLSAVEFFTVSVRTPGVGGTYRTPALQVYSDGEEVLWSGPEPSDPRPAPQVRVNGPERAPAAAAGVFRPLSELGGGNPCPQSVIDDAIEQGLDPAVHCGHFGFAPPADSPSTPEPPVDEPELDVRGTAQLFRTEDRTFLAVNVTGLEPGSTYDAHLHEGTCADPLSAHYKDDPAGPDAPPNELWPSSDLSDPTAGLTADSNGVVTGFAVADWVARPSARAVWIHAPADPAEPHVHARIGCADLV